MTTEQEALRLADLLQDEAGVDGYVHDEAAAMLRKLVAEREEYRAAMRKVEQAAEAVITRWDSPMWKQETATAALIHELRAAITDLRQRLEGTT